MTHLRARLFADRLILAGSTLLMVSAMPVLAQNIQVKTFNIPAQPAQQGIPQFAQQADLQLVVPEKLTLGQTTAAVKGTMPVRDGLRRLLAGTNLTPVTQGNGAVYLTQATVQRVSDSHAEVIASAGADPAPVQLAPQLASTPAAPEATPAEDTQVVVVKGTRGALVKARDIKRRAANMVESIVADDIGKMPDTNLAESIQRIPGVAMTREGGEGRNITLRGFAPDFTRTTLNGMEVPSSSDGLDSGGVTINAGRAFDFNVFASELFNRIDVEKTQKASIEEGGIAGTVDLYSARPFDFKGFTVSASAQDDYNGLSKINDPRFAFLISNKFFGGKLGVLFSAAVSTRTVHQEGYASVRWTSPFENGDAWADAGTVVKGTPSDYCGAADALNCLWAPRLPRADFFGNDQKRTGLTASVQYKPSDNVLITFDALHSNLLNDRYSYNSMEWLLTHGVAGNFTGQTPLSFTVAPDGMQIIAASFNDVTSWTESRHQESNSDFNQFVLNGNVRVSDKLTLNAMAGAASDHADRTELRFYYRSVPHFYSYDYTGNPYVPVISYGSYDPNNKNNYISALTAANRINKVHKDNFTSKFDAIYADQDFTFKAGFSYNDRKVKYAEGAGPSPSFVPTSYTTAFPYSDFGNGLRDGGTLLPFLVADFDAIAKAGVVAPGYTDTIANGWTVGEETLGGYVEMNSVYYINGMRLRANSGLRYVKTNVTSQAVLSGTPVKVKNTYDNYLPSLNLALEVTDDVVTRFSYGRSMTRPGLSSLNIAGPVFGYTTRTVGNIGNPALKPYQSNDTDFSVEWYFGKEGLVSLGVFNKDIVTSLKTQVVTKMIDPQYWPAIYADPQYDVSYNADPAKVPYTFTIPVNSDDGNSVRGFELTYNQPFTFLPGHFSNLGIASNYTHVIAKDSTGLSPNSYNLTLYYDAKDYGARVSVNRRDDYLLSEPGGNGHLQERKYGPTHVDFASYYNINKNFTLTFEGINITDEVERIYGTGDTGTMDLTREYSHTGSQWLIGIRYRN